MTETLPRCYKTVKMPSEPVTGSKRGLVELFDRDQFILLLGVLWFVITDMMKVIFIFTISWKSDIVKTVPAS